MIRRTKTLVVFNAWCGAVTSDGKTSEQCADAYALARGYTTTDGKYWKIGVDFGGKAMGRQYSTQTAAGFRTLMCVKSFAPGQVPETDNPRYTGRTMVEAIANMVADGQLDAIFTESLVPNGMPQCGGQAPDGWFIALSPYLWAQKVATGGGRGPVSDLYTDYLRMLPNPTLGNWITNNRDTQLPYGRIGYPGCSYAEIQRIAADANWGESQNNLAKPHVIGGTDYRDGGDKPHTTRANLSFAKYVTNLKAFNQSGDFSAGLDWNAFDLGTMTPAMSLFGLLFSRNPNNIFVPSPWRPMNSTCWTPQRGAWAFDWCSGSLAVGYDSLWRGGVASILCEVEPYANGVPAVDCVAYCLMLGLSMAEANFLSDQMQQSNHSVYGAPDYAPYAATNSVTGLIAPPVVIPPAPLERRVGLPDRRPKRTDRRTGVSDRRKAK